MPHSQSESIVHIIPKMFNLSWNFHHLLSSYIYKKWSPWYTRLQEYIIIDRSTRAVIFCSSSKRIFLLFLLFLSGYICSFFSLIFQWLSYIRWYLFTYIAIKYFYNTIATTTKIRTCSPLESCCSSVLVRFLTSIFQH